MPAAEEGRVPVLGLRWRTGWGAAALLGLSAAEVPATGRLNWGRAELLGPLLAGTGSDWVR